MIEYKIYKSVYESIIKGKKDIEFRLLNDKSNNIEIGSKIRFKVVDNEDLVIDVTVIDKLIYNNIDDLYNDKETISNNILSENKEELRNLFYQIFGKEKVDNSKIVGIKFKI